MRHTQAFYESYRQNEALLRQRLRELELADELKDGRLTAELRERTEEIKRSMAEVYNAIENYIPAGAPSVERKRLLKEQLFLRYYYILGLSMEETAEMMEVSRDTVYRIKKRAAPPLPPRSAAPADMDIRPARKSGA